MTEIWDLARYVEEHPDDRDQRWRLAKKLYTAWEYRLALEHLQVLKNDWPQKINVRRYLAATYYRLGRYAEAVTELRDALDQWPRELGLFEQLARVLEVSGDRIGAAGAWEEIGTIDPHHPIAKTASRRLREKAADDGGAKADLHIGDSDSGIDLSPGQVCPNCGAQNSDEYDRCWQCHAALQSGGPAPAPAAGGAAARETLVPLETLALGVGLAALGAVSAAAILSVQMLLSGGAAQPYTLAHLFLAEAAPTRIIVGVLLLVLWPGVLWVALGMVDPPYRIPAALVNGAGLLAAGLAYALTWLPRDLLPLAVLLPPAIVLAIMATGYRLGWRKTLAVWAVHLVVLVLAGAALLPLVERVQTGRFFNPLREAPALLAYAQRERQRETPGAYVLELTLPARRTVTFASTGSDWLDWRAGSVRTTVKILTPGVEVKFEIKDPTGTRAFEFLRDPAWTLPFQFTPGVPYEIILAEPAGAQVELELGTLLETRIAE